MNKYWIIVCLYFSLNACQYRVDSTEALASKIFESLKTGKFELVEPAILNEHALAVMYQQLHKEQHNTTVDQGKLSEQILHVKKLLGQNFNDILLKAKDRKILLEQCSYSHIKSELIKEKAFIEANVVMFLKFKNQEIKISFRAVEIEGIWYLLEDLKWEG